jgi:signal transduction histidine kinase
LVGQQFPGDTVRQAALSDTQGVIQSRGLDGTPRIYAYTAIVPDLGDIHVLVGIPERLALVDADYVRDRSILVLGLIALLGIAGAWFSGTIIIRPIHDLTQAIRSLGSGQFRSRTSLQSNIDELQELLVAFNDMATAVEQSMAVQLEQVTAAHAERLTLLEAEQQARTEAEQTAGRLSNLQSITAAFSEALTIDQIGAIIMGQAVAAVGALNGSFQLLVEEGTAFEMLVVAGEGVGEADRRIWQRYPADPSFPVTTVARTKQALWFESGDEVAKAYPALAELAKAYSGASVLMPISLGEKASGVISITFAEKRPFSEDDQAFLLALAHQCAQTIERIRLGVKEKELAILQERQRLARELHDAVTQSLFSANLITESLPGLWKRNPDKVFEQLRQLHQLTTGAAAEMRTLLLELRPENVVKTNLGDLLRQLGHALKARKQMIVSIQLKGDDMQSLSENVHFALYRIAQESLTNVVKHGNAKQVRVRLVQNPHQVELTIVDNGQGFDVKQLSAGFGLTSMRERTVSIGGTLQVKSRIGTGTRVKVVWKAEQGAEARV